MSGRSRSRSSIQRVAAGGTFIMFVCSVSCGGSGSSATAPSPSAGQNGPPSGNCRTYATALTAVTTNPNATATTNQTCNFDTSSNVLTCTASQRTDSRDCTVDSTRLTRYSSTADFVDEFMGRTLATGATVRPTPIATSCSGGVGVGSETTHTYDSERRLLQTEIVNPTGAGSPTMTWTFTAWDTRGRPTTGTVAIPGATTTSLTYRYDDAARTVTMNASGSGSSYVTTATYDADGIILREEGQPVGFITNDMTVTVSTTSARQQVCS